MGAYREAIPLLETLVRQNAATPDATYWLAISESQVGQFDASLTHVKLALQLDPGHFDAQRFLALLHVYRKECALAAQALEAARDLRPSYRDSDEYRQILAECGPR
jgi:tetratricopeptide (TPR) repeat protein